MIRRLHSRRSAARGFTLLETLIALIITALALAVLFHGGLGGLWSVQAASHYEQAIARARSHLAIAVHASPLIAGEWQGNDGGGFTWHVRVAPVANTTVRPVTGPTLLRGSSSFPLTLYSVTVWIGWHDIYGVRAVHLDTQQIGQGAR